MDLVYRAEVLADASEAAMRRRDALAGLPGYAVVDTLDAQLRDYVRSRNRACASGTVDIEHDVDTFLRSRPAPYGSWIHYPWSKRLVHTLEAAEFIELRTDRNRHRISRTEHLQLLGKVVGVVGLSVGQSVALTLALERSCGGLRLADFDAIDLSNLNRLRCGIHNVGLRKTVVTAREIAEIDPYLPVVCYHDGYTEADAHAFLDGLDLVVEECDSLDVKVALRLAARERRIPVLMNTSDRGMTDIERFDLDPVRPVFHGRLEGIDTACLAGLSTEDKVPVVMKILGAENLSTKLRASMLEIGQSISTWPQLASEVTLGGAIVCNVARRILLDEPVASGRFYCDLSDIGAHDQPVATPDMANPRDVADRRPADAASWESAAADVRDRIMADAALAPSAGNQQPWSWQRQGNRLMLQSRPRGSSSILYHGGKATLVGLGASFESALLSARHHGYEAREDILLDARRVAELSLAPGSVAGFEPLYPQLGRRRSVRTRPREVVPIPERDLASIASVAAGDEDLCLRLLTRRDSIRELAAIVAEAERLRMLDPRSHDEAEIAWSESEHARTGEGIPLTGAGLSQTEQTVMRMALDTQVLAHLEAWDLGHGIGKLSRELIDTSSAIGLLWSRGTTDADYFAGGRSLQRIWLEATRLDIGLCPVTPLCYLLSAWRTGQSITARQRLALPVMDRTIRNIFGLPEDRADIVLFRLLPAARELQQPRTTLRRPLHAAQCGGVRSVASEA